MMNMGGMGGDPMQGQGGMPVGNSAFEAGNPLKMMDQMDQMAS